MWLCLEKPRDGQGYRIERKPPVKSKWQERVRGGHCVGKEVSETRQEVQD